MKQVNTSRKRTGILFSFCIKHRVCVSIILCSAVKEEKNMHAGHNLHPCRATFVTTTDCLLGKLRSLNKIKQFKNVLGDFFKHIIPNFTHNLEQFPGAFITCIWLDLAGSIPLTALGYLLLIVEAALTMWKTSIFVAHGQTAK